MSSKRRNETPINEAIQPIKRDNWTLLLFSSGKMVYDDIWGMNRPSKQAYWIWQLRAKMARFPSHRLAYIFAKAGQEEVRVCDCDKVEDTEVG